MKVVNRHHRIVSRSAASVGALIDSLASSQDCLWPHYSWPKMRFDQPLGVNVRGGHGPIRYFVETYRPGKSISFRFSSPRGFRGFHRFEVTDDENNSCQLEHYLEMKTTGFALLTWPLIYRPLHDALIEDALATAQLNLQLHPDIHAWSLWVKCLRWILSAGKSSSQIIRSSI